MSIQPYIQQLQATSNMNFGRSRWSPLISFSGQGGFFSQTPQIAPPGFYTNSLVNNPASASAPVQILLAFFQQEHLQQDHLQQEHLLHLQSLALYLLLRKKTPWTVHMYKRCMFLLAY
jgi:hypothetical protein